MITRKEAARLAKRTLSQRRYEHTRNVEKLAVRLAERNGVSEEKAALAALLHDIAKELPKDRMLQIITENAIIAVSYTHLLPRGRWRRPSGPSPAAKSFPSTMRRRPSSRRKAWI